MQILHNSINLYNASINSACVHNYALVLIATTAQATRDFIHVFYVYTRTVARFARPLLACANGLHLCFYWIQGYCMHGTSVAGVKATFSVICGSL